MESKPRHKTGALGVEKSGSIGVKIDDPSVREGYLIYPMLTNTRRPNLFKASCDENTFKPPPPLRRANNECFSYSSQDH